MRPRRPGSEEALEENQRAFYEQQRAAAGADEASDLESAIVARDPRGAERSAEAGQDAWRQVALAYHRERALRGQPPPGPGQSELQALLGQNLEAHSAAVAEQIENVGRQVSPETMERAESLQNQQRDLDNRLQQAREQAQEFERQFPVRPEGLQEVARAGGGTHGPGRG